MASSRPKWTTLKSCGLMDSETFADWGRSFREATSIVFDMRYQAYCDPANNYHNGCSHAPTRCMAYAVGFERPDCQCRFCCNLRKEPFLGDKTAQLKDENAGGCYP